MATGGVLGNGVKIGFALTSPQSYVRIAQVQNVDKFFSLTKPVVDTTVHSLSTIKTAIQGLADPPQIQLTLLADNDQSSTPSHETLRLANLNNTVYWFRFEIPTNALQTIFRPIELQASVMTYDRSTLPIAGAQQTKVTLLYNGNYIEYNAAAGIL